MPYDIFLDSAQKNDEVRLYRSEQKYNCRKSKAHKGQFDGRDHRFYNLFQVLF